MTKRILVVDDEEVVLLSVRKALRKDDYQIDTVERAADGIALLHEQRYDVLITDLMMPEIDGLGLLERIRDMGLAIQTIMITGYPTVKTALKAKRLGAFEYVTKPFTRAELRSVVVRAVRRGSQRFSDQPQAPEGQQALTTYFIPDHSWARPQPDGTVLVGMARVFARSVGDVASVQLPETNEMLEQGRACIAIQAADGIAHSLHSPLSGRVIGVNPVLAADPAAASRDPEGEGWLFRLEPQDAERELQNLVPD